MKIDPQDLFILQQVLWPQVTFYSKEVEIIEASVTYKETHIPAGNKLGKDFACGFIAPACFLICQARGISCRIVTTSVAEDHLKVLWGEIGRFITTARQPLLASQGGPIVMNHQEIRRKEEAEARNAYNYLLGMVYEDPEKLAGHHAEFTMFIGDEASGLDDAAYRAAQGWAQHMLFPGNPNPCNNFWRQAIKQGDLVLA